MQPACQQSLSVCGSITDNGVKYVYVMTAIFVFFPHSYLIFLQ